MLRGPSTEASETLGELLKRKADEGVCVRIMVWNDSSSLDNKVLNKVFKFSEHGMMGVRDEETVRFFKKTGMRLWFLWVVVMCRCGYVGVSVCAPVKSKRQS